MPGIDWLSIWSMSLTVVDSTRSYGVMMRPAMSSGDRPWYVQAAAITGTLMSGKMSTGVRTAASTPTTATRMAMTMKVSGRDRATLTIPITERLQSERGTTGGDSRSRQTCPTIPLCGSAAGKCKGQCCLRLWHVMAVNARVLVAAARGPVIFDSGVERVTGIEPVYSAWKAAVLPLYYTRMLLKPLGFQAGSRGVFRPRERCGDSAGG